MSDQRNETPKILKTLEDLAEILRSDKGCPWDRKQTIESMLKHLDEEVHEIREAVEKSDFQNLREEIGDVLFQLVMIVQIAKEHKHFTMEDVIAGIEKKIIDRHTWVFGDDKADTPEEALELWKRNKQKE